MSHNPATNTIRFKAYRIPIRCWRCWKRYEVFTPYEFVDVSRLQCDRCSEVRISSYEQCTAAKSKYLDVHRSALRGWGGKKEERAFAEVFEEQWAEPCTCGGRFRFRAPFRCPHCRARALVFWWFRGEDEIVESPPIPVLRFTIPPEYANSPARPSWKPET